VAAHKKNISDMNGLGRTMPFTFAAFAIASLSMIGAPPVAGFITKWYLLLGALEAHHIGIILVLLTSTLLNAAYFVPVSYKAFFGKPPAGEAVEGIKEAPLSMVIPIMIAALIYTERLRAGARVAVPAVSWSTTYAPLIQFGLLLDLVDVDASLTIAPDYIDPNVDMVFGVNLLGNPCKFDALDWAPILIEDNCEALGAKYGGKMTGDLTELALYGGQGQGKLVLDASGDVPAVHKVFAMSGIQAEPLLSDAMGNDSLSGSGNLSFALDANGISQRQMVKNLGALHIERLRTEVAWDEHEMLAFFGKHGFAPTPRLVLEAAIDPDRR